MTKVSRVSFSFAALVSVFLLAVSLSERSQASSVSAFGRNYTKSDEAEICDATSGRYRLVRGFTSPFTFFVEFSQDPGAKPVVKEGYMHVQDASVLSVTNPISFEIFSLIADVFGDAPKAQDQWKSTYEKIFRGPVTVYDETGTVVTTFDAICNSVVVEFK